MPTTEEIMGQMGSDAGIYEDLEYCAVGLGEFDGPSISMVCCNCPTVDQCLSPLVIVTGKMNG